MDCTNRSDAMFSERPLAGKTAVITGASSGIGRATALTLSEAGAAVVIQARRRDRLDRLAEDISHCGGKALIVEGDAGLEADIDRLLDQTLAWEDGACKCDIVVVNAGRGLAGGILTSDQSQWQELYRVNVLGAAYLMRRAGQYMVERKGGDIVALSSVVAKNLSPFGAFYGSSKAAVSVIAEAVRRDVAPSGVRVSIVMPGIALSEFQEMAGYNQANFGNAVSQFGKLLQPKEIADTICWLLALPPHVNINEIMIRPTGQTYP
ncbi:MAG: SDR family oxidoreductase [Syntrophorhabdaceae bacterium]|nr:SDR family oxidoreductase [Syntrophorhabdaceae bacterium]